MKSATPVQYWPDRAFKRRAGNRIGRIANDFSNLMLECITILSIVARQFRRMAFVLLERCCR